MTITCVAWRGYSLPFRRPYATSRGMAASRSGLLVFLSTPEGLVGVGDASPIGPATPPELAPVVSALQALAPRLLGRKSGELEAIIALPRLPTPLRFGLETALLDLRGQSTGHPLAAILGGNPATFPVNALVAAESPAMAVLEAKKAVQEGFNVLKLKVGHDTPEQDETLVWALRQAVGKQVKLRIDPNQAWDVARAVDSLKRLSQYDIEYAEQPVPAADIDALAEVRRVSPIPIAADESLGSLRDLHRLLELDAADVFIIKAARMGLAAALEVSRAALKAGKLAVVTSSLESGVGLAAAAHLAAAVSPDGPAHGLATAQLFVEDLTLPPLLPQHGTLSSPARPGLGLAVNALSLAKYGLDIMGSSGAMSGLEEYLRPGPRS